MKAVALCRFSGSCLKVPNIQVVYDYTEHNMAGDPVGVVVKQQNVLKDLTVSLFPQAHFEGLLTQTCLSEFGSAG